MTTAIERLQDMLLASKDGVVACNLINKLGKYAKRGSGHAKQVLALYMRQGRISHMRTHACSCLAESVGERDGEFAALFRQGLSDADLRYWSILGYVRAAGKGAYKELTKIARDRGIPVEERAHAVKCLAACSGQPFDRSLPADPGYWNEGDLRLAELTAWARDGYPNGRGYARPKRDRTLDEPQTPLEKVASILDNKLARKRQKRQELADPTNWLAIAAPTDLKPIRAKWKLPSLYLTFLKRFSPIKVTLESRRFYNHFRLFGAGELLEAQHGYSFDPMHQQPIEDWPDGLVVVASHGGDPFVLNLSKSDCNDAPVETAKHGAGVWKFRPVADSFLEFLMTLAK